MDLSKAYQCPVTGRFYDPLRVRRELFERSGDQVNAWIAENQEGPLVQLARAVFNLKDLDPADGSGFLDAQALRCLDTFTEYLAGKVPTEPTSPTSAPCTDCP